MMNERKTDRKEFMGKTKTGTRVKGRMRVREKQIERSESASSKD